MKTFGWVSALAAGILLVSSSLLFTACSSNNTPTTAAPASPSAPAPTATPGPGLGVVWHQALADTASPGSNQFTERGFFPVVATNGFMWIFGGSNGLSLNDAWKSSDGVNWTQIL